jgi:hypothetical protein
MVWAMHESNVARAQDHLGIRVEVQQQRVSTASNSTMGRSGGYLPLVNMTQHGL